MDTGPHQLAPFRLLAEACAIGLLIGVERYKARKPGEKRFGSVRTFATIGLVGGVCGLLGQTALSTVAFASVAALVTIAFIRESGTSPGLTTEVAALAVFWLAFLVNSHEALAVSATIVLALLLASKRALHDFVKDSVSERELFDTLKFLAVVLVVYPLLPDRDLGPWGFFNPTRVWFLVILVSSVSYAGYLLVRWLGPRRGMLAGALAGGVVSTTATTQALAARSRKAPESSALLGLAGALANTVQLPKLLVLVWIANRWLGSELAAALGAGATASFVGLGAIALVSVRRDSRELSPALALGNPFSLAPALRFGLLFTAVLLAVKAGEAYFGGRGLLGATALAGAASASAASLSVANLPDLAKTVGSSAPLAVLLALSVNALVKLGLAWAQGSRGFAWRIGLGLALSLGAAWATFAFLS